MAEHKELSDADKHGEVQHQLPGVDAEAITAQGGAPANNQLPEAEVQALAQGDLSLEASLEDQFASFAEVSDLEEDEQLLSDLDEGPLHDSEFAGESMGGEQLLTEPVAELVAVCEGELASEGAQDVAARSDLPPLASAGDDLSSVVEIEDGAEDQLPLSNQDEAPAFDAEVVPVGAFSDINLLEAFESQASLAAEASHEDAGADFDGFVDVEDHEPENPLSEAGEASEVDAAPGQVPGNDEGTPHFDLGEVMDAAGDAPLEAALQDGASRPATTEPTLDPVLGERFGGYDNSREFLVNGGGVEALSAAIHAMRSAQTAKQQAAPDAALALDAADGHQTVGLTQNPNQAPGRGKQLSEEEERRQQPNYGLMASLMGGLAGMAVGSVAASFRGMAALANGAAKGGVGLYQSHIDTRNSREFERRFSDIEAITQEMRSQGADLLEGPVEERAQFFKSARMEEMVKRFSAAATALEQSAARKVSQGLKGGAEPSDIMRQTAERIAEYAERNKQLLEGLQMGGSTMLDRFDNITNNLFSMLKNALVQLARMVTGGGQQPSTAPAPAPSSGPRMG